MTKHVVNYYDEYGPTQIDDEDVKRRVESYAEDNGITSCHVRVDKRGYVYLTNIVARIGSRFQKWRERKSIEVPDNRHLSGVGSDTSGGSEP